MRRVCGIAGQYLDTASRGGTDNQRRKRKGLSGTQQSAGSQTAQSNGADHRGYGKRGSFTAVFIRTDEKKKGGINSPFLYPEAAILDPLLTVSVPPAVTASTGLDALCHAIESFLSRKANFMSEAVSLNAVKLMWNSLPAACENGNLLEHRANMLYSFSCRCQLANAGVTAFTRYHIRSEGFSAWPTARATDFFFHTSWSSTCLKPPAELHG